MLDFAAVMASAVVTDTLVRHLETALHRLHPTREIH